MSADSPRLRLPSCFRNREPQRGELTLVVDSRKQAFDVYIGPPVLGATEPWLIGYNPYRNPFIEGLDGDWQSVLERFRNLWVRRLCRKTPRWRAALRKLQGLRIACPCKTPCHGSILATLANQLPPESMFKAGSKGSHNDRTKRVAALAKKLRAAADRGMKPDGAKEGR
ncbi:MAG: DUF4326 domain-containing protein [Planctomycetes bacterium]|nr:DUF4326 domain-containing protein [Planctomycetota bacterium]